MNNNAKGKRKENRLAQMMREGFSGFFLLDYGIILRDGFCTYKVPEGGGFFYSLFFSFLKTLTTCPPANGQST